jgi:chloramphenicol-sensitive protein RarD
MRESSKGTLAAVAAFSIWGVLPIFWKMLADVPILQVTSHRVLWTLAIIIPIIIARKSWLSTIQAYKSPKALWIHSIAAVTLAANWLIYVWATLNGHIVEAALGYYINPFLYILLGYFFWKERHSRLQIIAIVVAAAGVALQFPAVEGVPWVAFFFGCTVAADGMFR